MDDTEVTDTNIDNSTKNEVILVAPKTELQPNGGRCGLLNIGNTCYMNTGLQCLSHIPDLVKLLLTDEFLSMINKSNPMGSGGLVTESFSVLLKQLWTTTQQFISPIFFKRAFQGYDSQFIGNDQHDSQEFFAKLVDVLHEDLNLIVKKPYIENPIYKEYNPSQAEEMWQIFLQRNTSKIVDLLYGMTCNQTRCTECGEMRIKYEPNNVLMIPMPQEVYQIPVNILFDREMSQSDPSEEQATNDEKKRKIRSRQRVNYFEVPYNFYGLYKEIYQAISNYLEVDMNRLDLIVKSQQEYDVYTRINPEDPQSSLSSYDQHSSYLICTVKAKANLKPLIVYPSQWTLYTSPTTDPYSELNHLDSAIMYYDPDEDLESVVSSLEKCFPSSFLAVKEDVKKKIEELMIEYIDRVSHPEKYGVKKVPGEDKKDVENEESNEEDEEDEKREFGGNEDIPSILSKFKKQTEETTTQEVSIDDAKEETKPDEEGYSDEEEDLEEEFDFNDAEKKDMEVDTDSDIESEETHLDSSSDDVMDLKRPFGSINGILMAPAMNSEESKRCCVQSSVLENPQMFIRWKDFGMKLPVINLPYSCYTTMPLPLSFLYFVFDERVRGHSAREFITQSSSELPSVSILISSESNHCQNPFYSITQTKKDSENVSECQKRIDEAENDMVLFLHTKLRSLFYCRSERYCTRRGEIDSVALADCLHLFELKGNMDTGSLWFCPKCQKDVLAESHTWIWKAPRYLILQLTRFEYVSNAQLGGTSFDFDSRKRKVATKVVFPLVDLDLTPFVHPDARNENESFIYDLIAVCNHMGNVDYGHYIAFCRDTNEGIPKWFEYDDERVTEINEEKVVTEEAYMLIYQRKDVGNISSEEVFKLAKEIQEKATKEM